MSNVIPFDQLGPLLRALPSLPRPLLHRLTERMIERLDVLDGDPDIEANGDELDGTAGEDDFYPHSNWRGEPGCPISDPDCCTASDDDVRSGVSLGLGDRGEQAYAGDEDDAEREDGIAPPEARKSRGAHRRRIRNTKCVPIHSKHHRGVDRYILRQTPRAPSIRTLRRHHPQLARKRKR